MQCVSGAGMGVPFSLALALTFPVQSLFFLLGDSHQSRILSETKAAPTEEKSVLSFLVVTSAWRLLCTSPDKANHIPKCHGNGWGGNTQGCMKENVLVHTCAAGSLCSLEMWGNYMWPIKIGNKDPPGDKGHGILGHLCKLLWSVVILQVLLVCCNKHREAEIWTQCL